MKVANKVLIAVAWQILTAQPIFTDLPNLVSPLVSQYTVPLNETDAVLTCSYKYHNPIDVHWLYKDSRVLPKGIIPSYFTPVVGVNYYSKTIQLYWSGSYSDRFRAGGPYTCKVVYENGEVVITTEVIPESPPEPPTNLKGTVTAASINLQWSAGFRGFYPQTFYVKVIYPNDFHETQILAHANVSYSEDDVVSYRLDDTMGIKSDQSYLVQILAQNRYGKVGGSYHTFKTKALPRFGNNTMKPKIEVRDGFAFIMYIFPEDVSNVSITQCVSDSDTCHTVSTTRTDTIDIPYVMALVDRNASNIEFAITLIEDGDALLTLKEMVKITPKTNQYIWLTMLLLPILIVLVAMIVWFLRCRKRSEITQPTKPENDETINEAYEKPRSASVPRASYRTIESHTKCDATEMKGDREMVDGTYLELTEDNDTEENDYENDYDSTYLTTHDAENTDSCITSQYINM